MLLSMLSLQGGFHHLPEQRTDKEWIRMPRFTVRRSLEHSEKIVGKPWNVGHMTQS